MAIDSFLVEKGVVNENNNIDYFVGLEDMWEFGSLQIRESGRQLSFLVTPGYYLDESKHENSNVNRLKTFDIYSTLGYFIRKPVSLKWQTNYDFVVNYLYTNKLEEQNISTSASRHYARAYSSAKLGYYPNTRTYLNISGRIELHNWSATHLLEERFACRLNLITSAYYYISQRLRLGGSVRFGYDKDGIFNKEIVNTTNRYFSYSLQLNYAIF